MQESLRSYAASTCVTASNLQAMVEAFLTHVGVPVFVDSLVVSFVEGVDGLESNLRDFRQEHVGFPK